MEVQFWSDSITKYNHLAGDCCTIKMIGRHCSAMSNQSCQTLSVHTVRMSGLYYTYSDVVVHVFTYRDTLHMQYIFSIYLPRWQVICLER
jgi:hypothetical protein